MNMSRSTYRAVRQNLLTSTGAVLAVLLGSSPTLAQNLQDVRADAARALVNQQANRAPTTAGANDTAQVISSEPVLSSSVSVRRCRHARAGKRPVDRSSDRPRRSTDADLQLDLWQVGCQRLRRGRWLQHLAVRQHPTRDRGGQYSLERAYALGDVDCRR